MLSGSKKAVRHCVYTQTVHTYANEKHNILAAAENRFAVLCERRVNVRVCVMCAMESTHVLIIHT